MKFTHFHFRIFTPSKPTFFAPVSQSENPSQRGPAKFPPFLSPTLNPPRHPSLSDLWVHPPSGHTASWIVIAFRGGLRVANAFMKSFSPYDQLPFHPTSSHTHYILFCHVWCPLSSLWLQATLKDIPLQSPQLKEQSQQPQRSDLPF